MTYKERLTQLTGDSKLIFNENYIGGVNGCPNDYFSKLNHSYKMCKGYSKSDENCKNCWDQIYCGEEFYRLEHSKNFIIRIIYSIIQRVLNRRRIQIKVNFKITEKWRDINE